MRVLLLVFSLLASLAGGPASSHNPVPSRPGQKLGPRPTIEQMMKGPHVRPGKKLYLTLPPTKPLPADRLGEIKRLIASLSEIESPDFGLSPGFTGEAFAPVSGLESKSVLLLAPHSTKTNAAFKRLVEIGPDALPFLLGALDSKTPTRLHIHTRRLDAVEFSREMWGNPVNHAEQRVLKHREQRGFGFARRQLAETDPYVVTVGDVCFVAIGQIVGRGYSAVRYQPTAIVIINSPSHDPELAKRVRQIWSGPEPRRRVLDSLLCDYATEGIFNGYSLDGWGLGSSLQCGAALRLLYYYPRQFAPELAARLRKLRVENTADPNRRDDEMGKYMARALANGVRVEEFIQAVAWSEEPQVKAALLHVFRKSEDSKIVLQALPALGQEHHSEAVRRLDGFLRREPRDAGGPFGVAYELLQAVCRLSDASARSSFRRYLGTNTVQRHRTAIHALRQTHPRWGLEVLSPLLDDRRTDGWTYPVVPGQNEPRLPIRVCDEAAVTMTIIDPHLKFAMSGSHQHLDEQINQIKAQIRP